MYENERTARVGVERSSGKKKQPLDHLTRDVLEAEKAGQSYGQWKAAHPHTASEDDEEEIIPPPTLTTCPQCGKQFASTYPLRRYCSEECKTRHDNLRRKQKGQICANCGKKYEPTRNGQKFCSSDCRIKYNNRLRDDRGQHTGDITHCIKCGKPFIIEGNRKKYCSDACYIIGQRQRDAARKRKKHQEEKEND